MDHDAEYIRRWREATIDPTMADEAELDIRRQMAAIAADQAKFGEEARKDKSPASCGLLHDVVAAIGREQAAISRLEKREADQREHRLRIVIDDLNARIRKLEAKAYPAGGRIP